MYYNIKIKNLILVLVFSIFSQTAAFADEQKQPKEPVVNILVPRYGSWKANASQVVKSTNPTEMSGKLMQASLSTLKTLIKTIKSDLCTGNKNGTFEVNFAFDAATKVFAIGIGAASSIKATIVCNDR